MGVLTLAAGPSVGDVPLGAEASFRLTGETGDEGLLCRKGLPDQPVTSVDRLSGSIAGRLARDLAGLAPADTSSVLPRSVRLVDLPTDGLRVDEAGRTVGEWSRTRDRLRVVLGRTAEGPVEIDLCGVGPHALVAGTTGSGKSELLQTLIASLALHHPPDRCSFLLVDYKGGAAFAEAAALPHTVGVVTDLDGQTTARALRSLTAELTRRESILAAHQVADVADLAEDVDLARLVIVVDEFATLADELPAFVPGLVSIAQRGRSLGVHLVLATQRPAGVVSPEIRANCSLRICLRTHRRGRLPRRGGHTRGRASARRPTGARLPPDRQRRSHAAADRSGGDVRSADHRRRALRAPLGLAGARRSDTGRTDRRERPGAVDPRGRRTCTPVGARSAHRPWRPPLPDRITVADVQDGSVGADRSATRLRMGLIDLPDTQTQRPLELDLDDGGTWLVVGGPRSGRTTLLRTVLREAVSQLGPDDLHVHVVESGGGQLAEETAGLPHAGTVISGEDRLRTVRLVERLSQEIATRRAGTGAAGLPRLLLLVDGMEELSTVIEEADPGHGAATPHPTAQGRRGSRSHLRGDRRPSRAGWPVGRRRAASTGAASRRPGGLRGGGCSAARGARAPATRSRSARRGRPRVPSGPPPPAGRRGQDVPPAPGTARCGSPSSRRIRYAAPARPGR